MPKPIKSGSSKKKYPKCSHYRNGKHRFGLDNLSFQDVCLYRDRDVEHICKCGFSRREWKAPI